MNPGCHPESPEWTQARAGATVSPMIFGDKPRGRESAAWRWVGLWVAFIYLTIPLARIIQESVRDRAGKEVFLWITFLAFAAAAAWIVRAFFRRQWKPRPAQIAVLCAIGGLFSWLVWSLRANPEEAFHFVQYGVLSVLLFRALRHRLSDSSIYLTATLIGSAFGILDELIQWVVPRRYFDFRDIWINVQATGLVQISLIAGIRPQGIRGRPTRAGLQLLCRASIAVLLLLLICVSGTPRAVAFITRFIPAAASLDHVSAEYGHRIEDPQIGVFFSRLTLEELLRQDREQGAETARTLNRVRSDEQYKAFLRETPVYLHPLAVEARIHLFRRDRYAGHALWATEPADAAYYAGVAHCENQIMEIYFSNTLHQSTYSWPPERIRRIEELAQDPGPYVSAVSRNLITRTTQVRITALLLALLLLAIAGERFAARKTRP